MLGAHKAIIDQWLHNAEQLAEGRWRQPFRRRAEPPTCPLLGLCERASLGIETWELTPAAARSAYICMLLVFTRHGHFSSNALSRAQRRKAPLTAHGRDAAKLTGHFLLANDITPDVVIATTTRRTIETAELILGELDLGDLAVRQTSSGFSSRGASLDDKVSEWTADAGFEPAVLLFVGHGLQQRYLIDVLGAGAAIPAHHRGCVVVCSRAADQNWRLVTCWPGLE